jgi:hypothetical protein
MYDDLNLAKQCYGVTRYLGVPLRSRRSTADEQSVLTISA